MSIDLAILGDKLRRYRQQLDLSLSEVKDATGIEESDLAAYEEGRKEPTGDELLILSDLYKCDYRFFISNQVLAPFEHTEKMFRKHGDELSKSDRMAILEFLYLCECEEQVAPNLTGLLGSDVSVRKRKPDELHKEHGRYAATEIRRYLGYSPWEIPENVYRDFRKLGLHVFRRQLGNSNISGLYIRHPEVGKCILVNYNEDVYRQRFTVAHEAAHAFLDDEQDFVVSFTHWQEDDLVEIRANNFAAEFLVPREFLVRIPEPQTWDERKVLHWANRLLVNPKTFVLALKEAGLVPPEKARALSRLRIPREWKRDPELPEDLSPSGRQLRLRLLRRGLSTFYVNRCFDAYYEGAISAGRLAEMLLIDEWELRTIAALFGRSIRYGS